MEKIVKGLEFELYELFLFSYDLGSEKAVRKALDSLMKDADAKTLNLCLDFPEKALG